MSPARDVDVHDAMRCGGIHRDDAATTADLDMVIEKIQPAEMPECGATMVLQSLSCVTSAGEERLVDEA